MQMNSEKNIKIHITDSNDNITEFTIPLEADISHYETIFRRILLWLEFHPSNIDELFNQESEMKISL